MKELEKKGYYWWICRIGIEGRNGLAMIDNNCIPKGVEICVLKDFRLCP
jgi:hypothetical protein